MRKIFNISVDEVIPPIGSVLAAQGIPLHLKPDERTLHLAEEAILLFRRYAQPTGIVMEISRDDFDVIYVGDGKNATDSPVEPIYKLSDDLALFAITIDESICAEISKLFERNDFALGSMLDAAASEGAELTAQWIENFYGKHLVKIGRFNNKNDILRFSPGYCGWHMSAQKKIFKTLRPEDIDIELNSSFLMKPLKSISGIIISGQKEIFEFDDTFSFCKDCTTHTCRDRIKAAIDR
jgi:hypothetical protein